MQRRARVVVLVALVAIATAVTVVVVHRRSGSRGQQISVTAFDEGLPTSGQWRNGFDLADINGDGQLDLIHGPARKRFPLQPAMFLGDGQGHWRAWKDATFPALRFDYGDVDAVDLDGDGITDLAFAVHLGGVVALRHDGAGHFSLLGRGLDIAPGAPFGSRTVVTADWNHDGHPVILALSDGPRPPSASGEATALGVRAYAMNAGEWRVTPLPGTDRLFGDSLAVGDIDGDGVLDLAVGSSVLGDTRVLFRHTGDTLTPVPLGGLPARSVVRSVALADLDADGHLDLVLSYANSEGERWFVGVDVFMSRGGAFERRALAREESRNDYSALAVCHFGSAPSIAVARGDGSVALLTTSGRTELVIPNTGREGCAGYRVRCADADHDGKDELFASFAGESDGADGTAACTSQGAIKAWTVSSGR